MDFLECVNHVTLNVRDVMDHHLQIVFHVTLVPQFLEDLFLPLGSVNVLQDTINLMILAYLVIIPV